MAHRILAVDDDPVIQRLLEVNLEMEGYEVLLASNGVEAVETAVDQRPDLVLMDVMMPDKDGYEACQDIHGHPDLGGIPVVLLSARAQEADIRKGSEVGAAAYVTKPFDPMDLLDVIRDLLA